MVHSLLPVSLMLYGPLHLFLFIYINLLSPLLQLRTGWRKLLNLCTSSSRPFGLLLSLVIFNGIIISEMDGWKAPNRSSYDATVVCKYLFWSLVPFPPYWRCFWVLTAWNLWRCDFVFHPEKDGVCEIVFWFGKHFFWKNFWNLAVGFSWDFVNWGFVLLGMGIGYVCLLVLELFFFFSLWAFCVLECWNSCRWDYVNWVFWFNNFDWNISAFWLFKLWKMRFLILGFWIESVFFFGLFFFISFFFVFSCNLTVQSSPKCYFFLVGCLSVWLWFYSRFWGSSAVFFFFFGSLSKMLSCEMCFCAFLLCLISTYFCTVWTCK